MFLIVEISKDYSHIYGNMLICFLAKSWIRRSITLFYISAACWFSIKTRNRSKQFACVRQELTKSTHQHICYKNNKIPSIPLSRLYAKLRYLAASCNNTFVIDPRLILGEQNGQPYFSKCQTIPLSC